MKSHRKNGWQLIVWFLLDGDGLDFTSHPGLRWRVLKLSPFLAMMVFLGQHWASGHMFGGDEVGILVWALEVYDWVGASPYTVSVRFYWNSSGLVGFSVISVNV